MCADTLPVLITGVVGFFFGFATASVVFSWIERRW